MNPDTLATTRLGLHRVAAYVVSPARRCATGNEIALTALPGGFGTAPFAGDEQVRVEGTRLVRRRGGEERAEQLTTLRAAGAFVGVEPDVEWGAEFDIPPPGDLEAPLGLDEAAARLLAGWFADAALALAQLRGEARVQDAVSEAILWPEHFDVAVDLGTEETGERATYGASPGDELHPAPYAYVSPWTKRDGAIWNDAAFHGASVPAAGLGEGTDRPAALLEFFRRGRAELLGC